MESLEVKSQEEGTKGQLVGGPRIPMLPEERAGIPDFCGHCGILFRSAICLFMHGFIQ